MGDGNGAAESWLQYASLTLLGNSEAAFPKSPQQAQIETFPNPKIARSYTIRLECPDFTSLCPVNVIKPANDCGAVTGLNLGAHVAMSFVKLVLPA